MRAVGFVGGAVTGRCDSVPIATDERPLLPSGSADQTQKKTSQSTAPRSDVTCVRISVGGARAAGASNRSRVRRCRAAGQNAEEAAGEEIIAAWGAPCAEAGAGPRQHAARRPAPPQLPPARGEKRRPAHAASLLAAQARKQATAADGALARGAGGRAGGARVLLLVDLVQVPQLVLELRAQGGKTGGRQLVGGWERRRAVGGWNVSSGRKRFVLTLAGSGSGAGTRQARLLLQTRALEHHRKARPLPRLARWREPGEGSHRFE